MANAANAAKTATIRDLLTDETFGEVLKALDPATLLRIYQDPVISEDQRKQLIKFMFATTAKEVFEMHMFRRLLELVLSIINGKKVYDKWYPHRQDPLKYKLHFDNNYYIELESQYSEPRFAIMFSRKLENQTKPSWWNQYMYQWPSDQKWNLVLESLIFATEYKWCRSPNKKVDELEELIQAIPKAVISPSTDNIKEKERGFLWLFLQRYRNSDMDDDVNSYKDFVTPQVDKYKTGFTTFLTSNLGTDKIALDIASVKYNQDKNLSDKDNEMIRDFIEMVQSMRKLLFPSKSTPTTRQTAGGKKQTKTIQWIPTDRKVSIKQKTSSGNDKMVQRTIYICPAKPGQERIRYKADDGTHKFKSCKHGK